MKKIKDLVKSIFTEGSFNAVFNGQATLFKYLQAVEEYKLLQRNKQSQLNNKILNKLNKHQEVQKIFSTLLFIDYLLTEGIQIIITKQNSQNSNSLKKDKVNVAQSKLLHFYFQYIRVISLRNFKIKVKSASVQQTLKQAKLIIEYMLQFLRIDFIIIFCLQNSKSSKILSFIFIKMLDQIRDDLIFLNCFVDKWSYLILQGQDTISMKINEKYEKLIYINKQFKKLEKLKQFLHKQINFPRYVINKELNKTIQAQIMYKAQNRKCVKELQSSRSFVVEKIQVNHFFDKNQSNTVTNQLYLEISQDEFI